MPNALSQRNYRVVDEHYALIPKNDIPRSTFNRIFEHKTTQGSGYLVPILVDEVLPGDVHSGHVTTFVRMATLLFPLMDNLTYETQFFFVPSRILWDNWKKFQGEQANPGDSTSYLIPQIALTGTDQAFSTSNTYYMLQDYMGIPLANFIGNTINVNALPFRAYNLIYNEWYRDQNLQSSTIVHKTDTGDVTSDYILLRRNKKHDYFTASLVSPQKGPPITLPLGGSAPVRGIGVKAPATLAGPFTVKETGNSAAIYTAAYDTGLVVNADVTTPWNPSVYADLSQASAATINALRLAVQTQKLLERDARGGTRYTESLQNHWGVHPQDARLQRPEYIGGGVTQIQTAAIAQTAPTPNASNTVTNQTPFGGLSGQATGAGQHRYTCIASEHGWIIGLASLMSKPTYQEGLHRMWTRQTRFDIAYPEFAALGEQAVRNDEIYATGTATDSLAFGYQERYAEYRFTPSRVSGNFRTKNQQSISQWHVAQSFSVQPTLGPTFIVENAPIGRALAAGPAADTQQVLADILFSVKTTRALPAYGVPGSLLGTF